MVLTIEDTKIWTELNMYHSIALQNSPLVQYPWRSKTKWCILLQGINFSFLFKCSFSNFLKNRNWKHYYLSFAWMHFKWENLFNHVNLRHGIMTLSISTGHQLLTCHMSSLQVHKQLAFPALAWYSLSKNMFQQRHHQNYITELLVVIITAHRVNCFLWGNSFHSFAIWNDSCVRFVWCWSATASKTEALDLCQGR